MKKTKKTDGPWRWTGCGFRVGGSRRRFCMDDQYDGPGGRVAIVRSTPEAHATMPRGRIRHPADLTRRFGVSKKVEYHKW